MKETKLISEYIINYRFAKDYLENGQTAKGLGLLEKNKDHKLKIDQYRQAKITRAKNRVRMFSASNIW